MTQETDDLKQAIEAARTRQSDVPNPTSGIVGYNTTVYILTDLLGCILVGMALGVFFQKIFGTSIVLTAVLTLLGGVAGLWTVIRYAMRLQHQQDAYLKEHPEPLKPIPEDDEEDI